MALTTSGVLLQARQAEIQDSISERGARDLLLRACAGDSIAFARLFDLYAERVYHYMYFNVADEQAAEDLTARVFLKAWRGIPCYQPERTPFGVWLYLLARNAVIEHGRSRRGAAGVREIVSPADDGLDSYETFEPCDKG